MATLEENREKVLQLYTAYFNRAADKNGVDYWTNNMINNNWSIEMVAQSFADQTEYTSVYGGLNSTQIVEKIYDNLLGRQTDAEGLAYWSGQLDSGVMAVQNVLQAILNAAVEISNDGNFKNPTDAATVNNKIEVSQYAYDLGLNEANISLSQVTADTIAQYKSILNEILDTYNDDLGVVDENGLIDAGDYADSGAVVTLNDGFATVNGYSTDDDYYIINNENSGYLDINLSNLENNIDIYLYDKDYNYIDGANRLQIADENIYSAINANEDYYIRVVNNGTNSNYTLDVSFDDTDKNINIEQNDDYGQANYHGIIDAGDDVYSATQLIFDDAISLYGFSDDNDIYKFNTGDKPDVNISISNNEETLEVYVLDSNFSVLGGDTASLSGILEADSDYYVWVYNLNDTSYNLDIQIA
jgi:hypothetical protein